MPQKISYGDVEQPVTNYVEVRLAVVERVENKLTVFQN